MSQATPVNAHRPLLRRPAFWIIAVFSWVMIIALLLVAIAVTRPKTSSGLPTDWHDISTPQHGQFVAYAVNPLTPSTAVALIGSLPQGSSGYPLGPGTFWRTTDGGATWHQIATAPKFLADTRVFYVRGSSVLFALTLESTPQTLYASHDDGATWRQITTSNQGGLKAAYYQLERTGFARDGLLYSQNYANGTDGITGSVFSVSNDDGATWTAREESGFNQAPSEQVAIAPDYRTPNGWFRLVITYQFLSPIQLQHSADGGVTWQDEATLSASANGSGASLNWLDLTADPAHPQTLCATTQIDAYQKSPYPAATLWRSDDGGATWVSASVGQAVVPTNNGPSVRMTSDGRCVTATSRYSSSSGANGIGTAQLWQWGAGQTSAQLMSELPYFQVLSFDLIAVDASTRAALVVQPITTSRPCSFFCLPPSANNTTPNSQFVWHALANGT